MFLVSQHRICPIRAANICTLLPPLVVAPPTAKLRTWYGPFDPFENCVLLLCIHKHNFTLPSTFITTFTALYSALGVVFHEYFSR